MPKLLKDNELDPLNEEVDLMMDKAAEDEAARQFARTPNPGDLSDGGMVNGVRLTPMSNGVKLTQGRANARKAWMWNGTETVLPLGWDPSGKVHDGARKYLLKRHCLCCNQGGFRGARCPNCAKNNCTRCNSSTDRTKIIPVFYLRREDVPFPIHFYGSVSCFIPLCPRGGDRGFKTEEEMRMHARSRHRMEYQAYTETQTAKRTDQVETLQRRVDDLMAALATKAATPQEPDGSARKEAARERMAHARAARYFKKQVAPEPVDAGVVPDAPATAN